MNVVLLVEKEICVDKDEMSHHAAFHPGLLRSKLFSVRHYLGILAALK